MDPNLDGVKKGAAFFPHKLQTAPTLFLARNRMQE
jgi:hypothetical protein